MKENETIEFKKSFAELKAGLISIVAMLNKHGRGELWFGVRNDGRAVGLEAGEKTLRDLSQSIAAHIEPKIFPQIRVETLKGKDCIRVVFSGKDIPYFAYGRAYMRVADEDRQLTARELENLIIAKNRDSHRWDSEICSATFSDLDENKLRRFVERAGLEWDSPLNVLEKLDLVKEGRLVNAAPLFLPNRPRCSCAALCLAGLPAPSLLIGMTLTATFLN